MGARDLLNDLIAAGLVVESESGNLVIRPASKLTDDLRIRVRDNKPALLVLLAEAGPKKMAGAVPPRQDRCCELGAAAGRLRGEPDVGKTLVSDDPRTAARRERLIHWGWPKAEADALADRLARRDREVDGRVSCTDCSHYQPGRCGRHRLAGLNSSEIGRDLAGTLQLCAAFTEKIQ
jgi:hypothetical protein